MYLQRFTPRRAKSIWSRINKEKAEHLIAKSRMKPSGLKAIEATMANGNWEHAYEPPSTAAMPEDFAIKLEHSIKAKTFYDSLDSQNKYAMLFRIHKARKPETRDKLMLQFISMLENGEKIYP